ncbi:hypothetical protein BX600DRAFT_509723 [Xylariales sp. PMI_506]|nr:hypothetical protein BX600DRAFT_509723 [Xylariales sp. PMI_506]
MSSNDNSSTLKSYVDSATGMVQDAFGKLTGSTEDRAEGQVKQNKAEAEHDASHATIKLPGATATASGVTRDDPDRAAGSWNQTVGAFKEGLGGAIGSESLKQAGRQQNREGQEQEARGQVNDYTKGLGDRAAGTIGGAVAGITGNKQAEAEYQKQHDLGKTAQRGAEHDILKQSNTPKEF